VPDLSGNIWWDKFVRLFILVHFLTTHDIILIFILSGPM
jgi:hypothetical protein